MREKAEIAELARRSDERALKLARLVDELEVDDDHERPCHHAARAW